MKRRAFLFVLALLGLPFAATAEEAKFAEDVHYFEVIPPQPGGEGDKIQVVEFFWYGCGHCFAFEPFLNDWAKNMPANVELTRVPAMFDRVEVVMHAQTYYALKLMGLDEKLHSVIFKAMHEEHRPLKTQEEMEAFLGENGVNVEEFHNNMTSFAVQTQARRAKVLGERYNISGVPNMVVDGKYRTSGLSGDQMVAVTNWLIEKVRADKAAAPAAK